METIKKCDEICDTIVVCDNCEDETCEEICEEVQSQCLSICTEYLEKPNS